MALPRIEYAVLPAGDGPGQDRCFTTDGLVVVLDGASAIDPVVNPDATEYVDTLGPLLIEQITGRTGIDLRDALAEAIRQTAWKLALVPGTAPSSTVSVVRWGEENVDILVLGDSPVIVQFTDGSTETVVQSPQEHIAPELRRRYKERLAAGSGYDSTHRTILAEIQRQEAALRNQPGGYFIAEAVPESASYATTVVWPSNSTRYIVVITDGAGRLFSHHGWRVGDFASFAESRIDALLGELERWEAVADPDGAAHPRSKRHDDKTLAVLTSAD